MAHALTGIGASEAAGIHAMVLTAGTRVAAYGKKQGWLGKAQLGLDIKRQAMSASEAWLREQLRDHRPHRGNLHTLLTDKLQSSDKHWRKQLDTAENSVSNAEYTEDGLSADK